MPELPEVETVRLGLVPAMEGARFVKVEARRPDLRWPFPKDFVARLEGKTVTGLGRRAKYLLADLSSGDVLIMHLGMSGSFRVGKDGVEATPGDSLLVEASTRSSWEDALQGIVFEDDLQICESHHYRTFNDPNPRVEVELWEVD